MWLPWRFCFPRNRRLQPRIVLGTAAVKTVPKMPVGAMMAPLAIRAEHRAIRAAGAEATPAGTMAQATLGGGTAERTTAEERTAIAAGEAVTDIFIGNNKGSLYGLGNHLGACFEAALALFHTSWPRSGSLSPRRSIRGLSLLATPMGLKRGRGRDEDYPRPRTNSGVIRVSGRTPTPPGLRGERSGEDHQGVVSRPCNSVCGQMAGSGHLRPS